MIINDWLNIDFDFEDDVDMPKCHCKIWRVPFSNLHLPNGPSCCSRIPFTAKAPRLKTLNSSCTCFDLPMCLPADQHWGDDPMKWHDFGAYSCKIYALYQCWH